MPILWMVKKLGAVNAYHYYTPYAVFDARYARDGKSIEVYIGDRQWILFSNIETDESVLWQNKTWKTPQSVRS